MPGSVGDPVVLDPSRTIIEVGWPNRIAISLWIKGKFGTGTREYAGESAVIEDPAGYHNIWVEWVGYWYGASFIPVYKWIGQEWIGQGSINTTDVEGLPDLPFVEPGTEASPGAVDVPSEKYTQGDLGQIEWSPPTGTVTTYPVPTVDPPQFFERGFEAKLAYHFEAFEVPLKWMLWPPPSEPISFFSYSAPASGNVLVSPIVLDFADVIVFHDDKAYKPEALKAIGNPAGDGKVWLLCKRSPADDPPPPP